MTLEELERRTEAQMLRTISWGHRRSATRRRRISVLRVLHWLLIITGLVALATAWPALAGCLFILWRLS